MACVMMPRRPQRPNLLTTKPIAASDPQTKGTMNKLTLLFSALALLSGCQSFPFSKSESAPVITDQASPAAPTEIEYASFSEQSLFELLSAELAGQRNRFDLALTHYQNQAQQTRDPAITERAFRIAEYLGAEQASLDSALLWAEVDPGNLDAQRAAALQLARSGQYDESMRIMERVLLSNGDTHFDFLALAAADTDAESRAGLLQSFDRLLNKNPDNEQLIFGKALLLQQDNQAEQALKLLEQQPLSTQQATPLLLRARLLQSLERSDEALKVLQQSLKYHPEDKRLRLGYARLLVERNQLDEAQEQFAELVQQNRTDDDLRFSLALVCLEAGAWDDAIPHLQTLIDRGSHVDAARFHLGRAYEELDDSDSAIGQYQQVNPGNEYLPAQQRLLALQVKAGRFDEAQRNAREAREQQPDYAVQLYLIEAEALNDADQVESAWALIHSAMEQHPEDLSLLYTRAMLAEKRGDLTLLEQDLRFMLEREPDNATALNALGYTLADRTTRFDEALELIEKAHLLNPTDPAILDSLGWVNYRMGNLAQAEALLRQALRQYPDAEIAAHLGEVLWAQGKEREAKAIWRQVLSESPDSAILKRTLKRLTGSERL